MVVVADVEAMYQKDLFNHENKRVLGFQWWEGGDLTKPLTTYCMEIQVLRAGPSGYNANTALRRSADHGFGSYDTDVITAGHRNFYVEDFFTLVSDVQTKIRFV